MITVWDISQTTSMEGVPEQIQYTPPLKSVQYYSCGNLLEEDVEDFYGLVRKLQMISPLPVKFERLRKKILGRCSYGNDIAVQPDLSQLQTIKTLLHEISHAYMHGNVVKRDKAQREMEAESCAFIVCQYFGMDTSSYSFKYLAHYGKGREKKDIQLFLARIQTVSQFLIDSIEGIGRKENHVVGGQEDMILLPDIKKASVLFEKKYPVYLLIPDKGDLYPTSLEQINAHSHSCCTHMETWRQYGLELAA